MRRAAQTSPAHQWYSSPTDNAIQMRTHTYTPENLCDIWCSYIWMYAFWARAAQPVRVMCSVILYRMEICAYTHNNIEFVVVRLEDCLMWAACHASHFLCGSAEASCLDVQCKFMVRAQKSGVELWPNWRMKMCANDVWCASHARCDFFHCIQHIFQIGAFAARCVIRFTPKTRIHPKTNWYQFVWQFYF